ncbi:fatty acid desaturase family protein [Novosphingobium album (ex Liu et al. 2023)]|uniref:Fatty acid desaturase n=1 Tax=Novosphingobium album (ex Liu et al. 2023) TaxID=3031130 RepID=A0ABT5WRM3_9SPHN|nr:fatty acid desaturase [Novosphingobium album (ex Liu et al. 2023)]MDE8652391.1 fatty acid desaturase [Novosphingobium album (ex Liu et al. 2023)]
MTAHDAIDMSTSAPVGAGRRTDRAPIPDDKEMLRAAVELTRDIATARPEIYWPDMLASAAIGYGALAGAILLDNPWAAAASGVVAALALYRALLFIHELTHIHRDALPGFRFAWNLLVGIPVLIPSFMYEGVHTLHHARTRYGTIEDPEYLPLALMKPWSLPWFILVSLLLPPALLLRSAVLVPLGAVIPPLRRLVWERFSSLSINPAFRRRPPEGDFARMVFWQELGAALWALTLLASTIWLGWRPLAIALVVVAGTAVLNQIRTLVAHLWENEGETMTVTAQYLDSVNVPPPALLTPFWAPVGLRYHATHHLLPSVPYHALGEAHRRLAAHLGAQSTFERASYPGLFPLVARLARSTMRGG